MKKVEYVHSVNMFIAKGTKFLVDGKEYELWTSHYGKTTLGEWEHPKGGTEESYNAVLKNIGITWEDLINAQSEYFENHPEEKENV